MATADTVKDCLPQRKRNDGVALLSVVMVLTTLLIVGVLFATAVDLDLRAARYYRDAGQAELIAMEGLSRAIAELQYDIWGVNESTAFKLANGKERLRTGAAYRNTNSGPIIAPRSNWRQAVEMDLDGKRGVNVLSDYRWIVEFSPGTRRGVHSGAVYHDEFLPEFTDNSDVWELGLHVNRGDIYFEDLPPRSYGNDYKFVGGMWPGNSTGFWQRNSEPWDKEWDYIDTRICGDSFYKIFRAELIDPDSQFSSYADARLDGSPMDKRAKWTQMKTHIGKANFLGRYPVDNRGGAVNINQVNNNYQFETYYAQVVPRGAYVPFHYKDSKWIYVHAEDGFKRGRYAVLVWADGGVPNVNYIAGPEQGRTYTFMKTSEYFRLLDTAFAPNGGPIGAPIWSAKADTGADIIKTNVGNDWHSKLGTAIAQHVGDRASITSRAELNMFMRKTGGGGALDTILDADNDGTADIADDVEVLASLVSVHAYENLMGPHWEKDRIILDSLGFNDPADRTEKQVPEKALPQNSEGTVSSYVAATGPGKDTRLQILNTLDELRFYWGPDDAREGGFTPYREGSASGSGHPDEARTAKSKFMSWVAASSFWQLNNLLARASNIGWAFDANPDLANPDFIGSGGGPVGKRDPLKADTSLGTLNERTSHSWPHTPAINEVGTFTAAHVTRLLRDLKAQDCRGASNDSLPDILDPARSYHFIEFVDQWDFSYFHSSFSFRGHKRGMGDGYKWTIGTRYRARLKLHVEGSTDIFADPDTRIICIDSDLDDRNGPDGYYSEEFKAPYVFTGHHVGQDKRRHKDSSGYAGQWASDPPMVAPTQAEREHDSDGNGISGPGLTSRDRLDGRHITADGTYWDPAAPPPADVNGDGRLNYQDAYAAGGDILVNSFNKFRYYPGHQGGRFAGGIRKESHGRYLPVNYLLVLFDASRFAGRTILLVVEADGEDRVVDYVKLPGDLSDGYSCYDFLTNQHPIRWERTDNVHLEDGGKATPAWRRRTTRKALAGGRAWAHGLNANFISTWLPGGENWPSPVTPSGIPFKLMGVSGLSSGGLKASGEHLNECSWPAVGLAEIANVAQSRGVGLGGWDRLMACPLGFFPRRPWPGAPERPDLLMRILRDLMRTAPVEQYFALGYMGLPWYADITKHQNYLVYDGFDNNADGRTDNLATQAIYPTSAFYKKGHSRGHYLGDRSVIGRININELAHPAAIWYCAQAQNRSRHPNTIVGRKPLKGYTTWVDIVTRTDYYGQSNKTPYNLQVWYENLFADCSADHFHGLGGAETIGSQLSATSRILYAGNSPVYTVYVTAQVLDDQEEALAAIKIRCTLERTWDGKTNLLDFTWIGTDVRP